MIGAAAMTEGAVDWERRAEEEALGRAAHEGGAAPAFESDRQRWEELPEWVQARYVAAGIAVERVVLDRLRDVLSAVAHDRQTSDDQGYGPALEDVADRMGLERFGL